MKTTEVNKELIGKRCECIFTGLMVTGVIEDIEDDRHSTAVKSASTTRTSGAMICIMMCGRGGAKLTSSARCIICNCWWINRTFK